MRRRAHGEGTVYKHKTKPFYIAQIDLPRGDDGKRRRISASGKTQKKARENLRGKLESIDLERDVATAPIDGETTRTYLERWLRHKGPGLHPRTIEIYEGEIKNHILPHIGDIPLAGLKPIHVADMVDAIVATGKRPTANKCRTRLFSALKQAVRWELIDKNPADGTDTVKEDKKNKHLWTKDEARRFIDHHRNHRHFAAFYLLLVSGVRRGELLGLRWDDVTAAGINIVKTVTIVAHKPFIGPTKTRASSRFIALPPDALAVLAEHRHRQDAAKAIVGATWAHPELVFPSEIGTPMHPRNFLEDWTNAVKRAGVPHATIHDMRHLNITLSILRGDDPKLIADRAGHSSTAFTLDHYGHVYREHRQRGARSLEDLLGGTATPTTSEADPGANDPHGAEEGGGDTGDT